MEKQILEGTSNFVSLEERLRLVRLCTNITHGGDVAEGASAGKTFQKTGKNHLEFSEYQLSKAQKNVTESATFTKP
jgi:hypothetical protein